MEHYTPDDIKDVHAISKRIEEKVLASIENPTRAKMRLNKPSKGATAILTVVLIILFKSIGGVSEEPFERLRSASVSEHNFFAHPIQSTWQQFEQLAAPQQPIVTLTEGRPSIDGLYIGMHKKTIPLVFGDQYTITALPNTENTYIYTYGQSIQIHVFNDYVYKIEFYHVDLHVLAEAYEASTLEKIQNSDQTLLYDALSQAVITTHQTDAERATIVIEKGHITKRESYKPF